MNDEWIKIIISTENNEAAGSLANDYITIVEHPIYVINSIIEIILCKLFVFAFLCFMFKRMKDLIPPCNQPAINAELHWAVDLKVKSKVDRLRHQAYVFQMATFYDPLTVIIISSDARKRFTGRRWPDLASSHNHFPHSKLHFDHCLCLLRASIVPAAAP